MSEPATKARQPIDLEEFERRLRASSQVAEAGHDPLAELARLVGHHDPFQDNAASRPAAAPRIQQVHPVAAAAEPDDTTDYSHYYETPDRVHDAHALHEHYDEPAADPHGYDLRGTLDEAHAGEASEYDHHAYSAAPHAHDHDDMAAHADFAATGVLPPEVVKPETPRRSVRGLMLLVTVLGAGAVGLGAAFGLKSPGIAGGTSKAPPIIMAGGPAKVMVENPVTTDPADQVGSVLDRANAGKPVAAKVVSNEEQPVDLSQQPKQQSKSVQVASADPFADAAGPAPVAAAPASPGKQPTGAVRTTDTGEMSVGTGNGFPQPKRVKVVSVRPDGSIIGSETAPSIGGVGPNWSTAAPPAPEPEAAAPAPDTTQAAAPPVAEPDAADDAATAKAKPGTGGTAAADDAPTKPAKKVKPKPAQVADAGDTDGAAAATASGGAFAVQLAASPTEAEAREQMSRLQKKFAGDLGGRKTTFHRVKVGDKSVYRVRVSNLSHDEATAMCSKLQASGGSCFVAGQN